MAWDFRSFRSSRRSLGRIAAFAVLALVGAALAGALVARERLVGVAVRTWLEAAGAGPTSWSRLDLGLGEARLEGLRIGSEAAAERIFVRYRWPDLLSGRIAEAEIQGLVLNLADGDAGLVSLARRRFGSGAGTSAARLPNVLIGNATARANVLGISVALAFNARLDTDGTAELRFHNATLRTDGGSASVAARGLKGTVSYRAGQVQLSINAEAIEMGGAEMRETSAVVALESLQPPWRITLGPASARILLKGREIVLDAVKSSIEAKRGDGAIAAAARIAELVFRQGTGNSLSRPFRGEGSVSLENGALVGDFAIVPPGATTALLHLNGRLNLIDGTVDARARLAPTTWGEGGLRLSDLSPEFARIDVVRGKVVGAISVTCHKRPCNGSAEARLDDISIAAPMAWIEGLAGNLHLSRFDPLTSSGAQEIEALRIAIAGGPVEVPEFESPRLRLRIGPEADGRIATIERAEVGLVGMRLSISDVAVTPGASSHRLVLGIEKADLARLLPTLGIDGVSGTGTLAGTIPIEVKGEMVSVADGRLAATGPGVLRIQNETVRRALAAGGERAEIAAQAIEDFRFSKFVLSLDKDADGEATIALSTAGHNPAVLDGHPLVLNVNLRGNFDRLLHQVQRLYALSDRALGATIKK